jgi:fusaric acid resistance family protein
VVNRAAARAAVVAMVGALLSFWSVRDLAGAAHQSLDLIVLAVALGITLGRLPAGRVPLAGAALLPAFALVAAEADALLAAYPTLGDAAFTVALAATVWVRRFGVLAGRLGTLAALPFIATLILPLPQPHTPAYPLWTALAAAITAGWVVLVRAIAGTGPVGRSAAPSARSSTRMAVQLAVALGGAFAVGRVVLPGHWVWPVLTAYIVCSGNRGRADVAYKGVLRMAGALAGTVAATPLIGLFAAGGGGAIAVILAVLAVAVWLRPASYAYWAGCVTAALALLYGYFGQTAGSLLHTRLAGIACGGLIAVTACWLVLPVRTSDVLRRRTADALAALADTLAARDDAAHGRLARAVRGVEELAPPLVAARRLVRRGPHPADAVAAVRRCAAAPAPDGPGRAAAIRTVGGLRRALAGGPVPAVPEAGELGVALGQLAAALPALSRPAARPRRG